MAGIVALVADSLTVATVTFGAAVDPTTVKAPAWSVVAPAGAQPVDVVLVVVQPGALIATLYIATQFTPGKTYAFTVTGGKTALGAALNPATANCVVGPLAPKLGDEWPHGGLDALTQSAADEIQVFCGVPMTALLVDLHDDDTVAYVETTLAFPPSGAIYVRDRRYTYTSKTDCSFKGLEYQFSNGLIMPAGSEVLCDVRAVLPD